MPADPLPAWVPVRRRAVGLRIARARQQRGLAVDDLAGLAGLDRKTIMTTESGRHAPTLDTLLLIAHGLGIPAAVLLADDGPAAGTGMPGDGTA